MSKPILTPEQIRTVLGDTCAPAAGEMGAMGCSIRPASGNPVPISQTRGVPDWTQEPWEDKEAVLARVARTDSALREALEKLRRATGFHPLTEQVRLREQLSLVDATVLLRQWLWLHAEYMCEEDRQRLRAVIVGLEDRFDLFVGLARRNGGEIPG